MNIKRRDIKSRPYKRLFAFTKITKEEVDTLRKRHPRSLWIDGDIGAYLNSIKKNKHTVVYGEKNTPIPILTTRNLAVFNSYIKMRGGKKNLPKYSGIFRIEYYNSKDRLQIIHNI
jgi:hypothetical protein